MRCVVLAGKNASVFVFPVSLHPGNDFRNHGELAHVKIPKYVEDYGDELDDERW